MSATPPDDSWPALAGVIADARCAGADAVAKVHSANPGSAQRDGLAVLVAKFR